MAPEVIVHPWSCYSVREKDPKVLKETSKSARIDRMEEKYRQGKRISVHAILLVHVDKCPCVLLLKRKDGEAGYKLPGGMLMRGENEIEGLERKLNRQLGATSYSIEDEVVWPIDECVGVWWRPDFNDTMYPYPTNNMEQKECKKLFLVRWSAGESLHVPQNMELSAVPLSELYFSELHYQPQEQTSTEKQHYGPVILSIPKHLSRFQLQML